MSSTRIQSHVTQHKFKKGDYAWIKYPRHLVLVLENESVNGFGHSDIVLVRWVKYPTMKAGIYTSILTPATDAEVREFILEYELQR